MTDATSAYLSQADLVEFLGRRSTEQAAEIERLQEAGVKLCQQNDDLRADNRRWSKVADERSKENCALKQLLRDARDHVPWDVLKRIDAALGAARVEQTGDGNGG